MLITKTRLERDFKPWGKYVFLAKPCGVFWLYTYTDRQREKWIVWLIDHVASIPKKGQNVPFLIYLLHQKQLKYSRIWNRLVNKARGGPRGPRDVGILQYKNNIPSISN